MFEYQINKQVANLYPSLKTSHLYGLDARVFFWSRGKCSNAPVFHMVLHEQESDVSFFLNLSDCLSFSNSSGQRFNYDFGYVFSELTGKCLFVTFDDISMVPMGEKKFVKPDEVVFWSLDKVYEVWNFAHESVLDGDKHVCLSVALSILMNMAYGRCVFDCSWFSKYIKSDVVYSWLPVVASQMQLYGGLYTEMSGFLQPNYLIQQLEAGYMLLLPLERGMCIPKFDGSYFINAVPHACLVFVDETKNLWFVDEVGVKSITYKYINMLDRVYSKLNSDVSLWYDGCMVVGILNEGDRYGK